MKRHPRYQPTTKLPRSAAAVRVAAKSSFETLSDTRQQQARFSAQDHGTAFPSEASPALRASAHPVICYQASPLQLPHRTSSYPQPKERWRRPGRLLRRQKRSLALRAPRSTAVTMLLLGWLLNSGALRPPSIVCQRWRSPQYRAASRWRQVHGTPPQPPPALRRAGSTYAFACPPKFARTRRWRDA